MDNKEIEDKLDNLTKSSQANTDGLMQLLKKNGKKIALGALAALILTTSMVGVMGQPKYSAMDKSNSTQTEKVVQHTQESTQVLKLIEVAQERIPETVQQLLEDKFDIDDANYIVSMDSIKHSTQVNVKDTDGLKMLVNVLTGFSKKSDMTAEYMSDLGINEAQLDSIIATALNSNGLKENIQSNYMEIYTIGSIGKIISSTKMVNDMGHFDTPEISVEQGQGQVRRDLKSYNQQSYTKAHSSHKNI